MEENNNSPYQFNPRRYESHLSLFGKKVLENLINQWVEDRNRVKALSTSSFEPRIPPPYCHQAQRKKVLTFLSEEPRDFQRPLPSPPPPIPCVDISNENDDVDQHFDINAVRILHPVPNVIELLKTVTSIENKTKKDAPNTQKALITNSLLMCDEVNAINYKLSDPVIDVYEERTSNDRSDDKKYTNNVNCDTSENGDLGPLVNWDDMFDTELLPVDTNAKLMIQQNEISNMAEETINIMTHREDSECPILTKKQDKKNKKEITQTDAIKPKRKVQSKVTEVVSKKNKRINETEKPECVLRKEKYTKTVQKWLVNVDLYNPVEFEIVSKPINNEKTVIEKYTLKNYRDIKENKIIIEKVKEKPKKKEVQAQLANKDGKMKFRKPKDNIETEITSNKTENDKSDKPKEKKTKPKFVAPIKSQVPVKEVDYKVVTVASNNITDLTTTLLSIQDKYITIVLIYSNGFSQLNQHHTEDSCEQDGLIVNIEEQLLFYYFKGVHQCFKSVLEALLRNNSIICYEGKSLLIYVKSKFGIEFKDMTMIDAKIGGSLLDPDNPPETFSELQKLLLHCPQYTIATECALQKTAWYAILLGECAVRLTAQLKENGLWTVFVEVEMKLVPIIAEMERRGVAVDLPKLKSMEDILLSKMKEIEHECYKTAGKTFQINSAVQVRSILYEELQLDTKCKVKIRETLCLGAKSTSETMLRSLMSEHPLPKLILEYRHLHKVHATFLTGIAHHITDGIVRPTWVQTAAATGRIASNNPNLQAIPKIPFSLVLFPDENNSGNQTLHIRSVYCARAGYTLLAADFRHVECRVFAHCADDRALLAALHAGGDLFRTLSRMWLNKPESAVSAEERERTKRLVYASLYGAGAGKLMDILGDTYEHTLNIMTTFNRTFPSLKSFGVSVVARCRERGARLHTLRGRSRRFPHIASEDAARRTQAERQAVNFVIQGSAADLCKTAMVLSSSALRAHRPPLDTSLLLQIHDELVWELRDDHLHTAAGIIKQVMESCGQHCGMSMSLPVALSVGRTWGDLVEYTPHL